MPRRRRKDYPGAWWHLGNKGVAGRSLFTKPSDYRYFLSLLAHAVRKGWIEVHAYCLMTNHFHLLVRSRTGELSTAMQWIEDKYARRFNFKLDRKGPLFEGRFWGKRIHNLIYRRAVLGYIHANPRRAGIDLPPGGYPWSSEPHLAPGCGRPWLQRTFSRHVHPSVRSGEAVPPALVEGWKRSTSEDLRELDVLVPAPSGKVQAWLERNARLADGSTRPRFLVCPETLGRTLESTKGGAPDAVTRIGRRTHGTWDLLAAGLMRTACACSLQEIADRVDVTVAAVHRRVHLHQRALLECPVYAEVAGRLLHDCFQHDYRALAA